MSLRDKNVADVSGSNGFESDNDAAGSDNAKRELNNPSKFYVDISSWNYIRNVVG